MTPEQEANLIETVTRTGTKMDLLIGDDGSTGAIPRMQDNHDTLVRQVGKQGEQINYWRGAIAIIGTIVAVFGGALLTHLLGGK